MRAASKRLLVFQLGSKSELLQSLISLRAAKQLYPGLEITLVVSTTGQEIVDRVPWIRERRVLPVEDLVLLSRQDPKRAMANLGAWTAPLLEVNWDYLANWSSGASGAFLATLPAAKVRLGRMARKDLSLRNLDGWSQYLRGIVEESGDKVSQGIHRIDLWTTQLLTALQIHEGPVKESDPAGLSGRGFFQLSMGREDVLTTLKGARKWVAVQVDGPTLKVTEALLSSRSDLNLVLLGKEAQSTDLETVRRLQALAPSRVLNLMGQTDFDLWASVISRCHWILSRPSPAVQLASLLGTQVLLFGDQIRGRLQTLGPYGNGHYVLIPKGEREISAEEICAVFDFASSEWSIHRAASLRKHLHESGLSDPEQRLSVLRSRIRTSGEGGGVRFDSVLQEPWDIAQWSAYALSQLARHWYCGWTTSLHREMTRSELTPALVIHLRGLDEILYGCEATLQRGIRSSAELASDARRLVSSRVMAIEDRDRLRAQVEGLGEIDSFLDRLGNLHPVVHGLANLRKVLFNDLEDSDLAVLGKAAETSYRQLLEGVGVLRKTIAETLAFAKPRALERGNVLPFAETNP